MKVTLTVSYVLDVDADSRELAESRLRGYVEQVDARYYPLPFAVHGSGFSYDQIKARITRISFPKKVTT